jgi:hypothetical protein
MQIHFTVNSVTFNGFYFLSKPRLITSSGKYTQFKKQTDIVGNKDGHGRKGFLLINTLNNLIFYNAWIRCVLQLHFIDGLLSEPPNVCL